MSTYCKTYGCLKNYNYRFSHIENACDLCFYFLYRTVLSNLCYLQECLNASLQWNNPPSFITTLLLLCNHFRSEVKSTVTYQSLLLWDDSVNKPSLIFWTKICSVCFWKKKMTEIFSCTACRQLFQMLFAVIFFHSSEYILALATHGKNSVNVRSLLISKNYAVAMACSLIEYFVEIHFFPSLKEHWSVSNTGLALVVVGEIIRKLAIITAGRSFTHLIKRHHEEHHILITHGVYKYIRHPSYCGFFIWSVGTQIMLYNPLSALAFAVVVWHFFRQRIPYEEFFLRQFFGLEYEEYAARTTTGIPFIK